MDEIITVYRKTVTNKKCPYCGEGFLKVDPMWIALGPDKYPGEAIPNICDACWRTSTQDKAYPVVEEVEIAVETRAV